MAATIRTHFVLMMLGLAVPISVRIGANAYRDRRDSVAQAKTSLKAVSSLLATAAERKFAAARGAAAWLAAQPVGTALDEDDCKRVRELHLPEAGFGGAFYTDPTGRAFCAPAGPHGAQAALELSGSLRQAFVEEGIHLAAPTRDPRTGGWEALVSAPVLGDGGALLGAVHLRVDLASCDPGIPQGQLPEGSRYGLFADDGLLVWRNRDPEQVIGTRPNAEAARRIVREQNAEFESVAVDGVTRLFASTSIPSLRWVAFVGVPSATVYSMARQRAAFGASLALLGVTVLAVAATLLARRMEQPIRSLSNAARALRSGRTDVRAVPSGPAELVEVATEFNAMVETVTRVEAELRAHRANVDDHVAERAAAMKQAPLGMWLLDAAGRVIDCNDKFAEYAGAPRAKILGFNMLTDATDKGLAEPIRRALAGETVELETEYTSTLGGRRGHYKYHFKSIMVAGEFVTLLCFAEDVGARKRMELTVRESEARFRMLFEQSESVMLLVDPESGAIVQANEAAASYYGYPLAELVGLPASALNAVGPDALGPAQPRGPRSERTSVSLRHRLASGELRDVEIYSTPTTVGDRRLRFSIVHDVTERRRAEEARLDHERSLQQALKAESLGRMAGAIAHNYNNLLGAVIGSLELANMERAQGKPIDENLSEALKAARRAAEVSSLMLTYLGQAPAKRELLSVSELCRRAIEGLAGTLPQSTRLSVDLPPSGPTLEANAHQLQQVLTNLVTNACESQSSGGCTVHIGVTTVSAAAIPAVHRFPHDWQPQHERYACLTVRDDGTGIAEDDFERIFDPFYSRKFVGRGLGLPVVLGIVRSHGGVITIESVLGRGTCVRAHFPLPLGLSMRPPRAPQGPAAPLPRGGAVLLIDDEASVRRTAKAMLRSLGFSVLEAESGEQALEVLREHRAEVRLVLCDLSMHGMDGWDVIATLQRESPPLPVILTSGYDQAEVMAGEHAAWPQAFLGKPFNLGSLRDAMTEALGGRVGSDPPVRG